MNSLKDKDIFENKNLFMDNKIVNLPALQPNGLLHIYKDILPEINMIKANGEKTQCEIEIKRID